jgi:hypothetical protein
MKSNIKILLLLPLLFVTITLFGQTESQKIEICAASAGADATYLKDFVVQLEGSQSDEKAPVAKYSMVLSKDTKYRFSICTDDDSPGRAMIQLYDGQRLLGSSFNPQTGKEFPGFDFDCQKTGVYHVFISFQEGRSGSAIGILSFIKKL